MAKYDNPFLNSLAAALENQEPTDEIMKEATGASDPDLDSQKIPNEDNSGNPPAPGDKDASPVGTPDPDRDPDETDLQAQKDATDAEDGNVKTPGDPNGNPNPTHAPSAANEAFGMEKKLPTYNKALNMNPVERAKIVVPVYVAKKKCELDDNATQAEYTNPDLDPEDSYPKDKTKLVKTDAGTVIVFTADDEEVTMNNAGDIIFACKDKKLLRIIPAKRAIKIAAITLNKSGDEPATEMEGFSEDTLDGFPANRDLHKNRNLIPLQQEKDARDPSGNTGDPAKTKRTPVSVSGDSKIIDVDAFVKASYDKDGNAGSPGVNGTPVSKSGDSKVLGKNDFEKAADDKDGNPDSPGVNGNPVDPTFESFCAALEQLMDEDRPGVLHIPTNMSLESYALELGMGEIAAKAMEAKLTAAERRALKDSDFGLPETRQWPLNDEDHVRSAITNFHWCPQEKQRELAKNILKAIRRFGMTDIQITEGSPFAKYCPDAIIVPRKKANKTQK